MGRSALEGAQPVFFLDIASWIRTKDYINKNNKMKKSLFFTFIFFALFATKSWAQGGAPEKISFQAVVRDASNALVTNHAVGMRISILQGSASGSSVYSETQTLLPPLLLALWYLQQLDTNSLLLNSNFYTYNHESA